MDSFARDAVGRITGGSSQRYLTSISRGFDSGGRLASETITLLASEQAYVVSYSYDAADRLATLTYPDGSTVSRTYTNRNQLATISVGAQSIAQYGHDDGARLTTATLGNGLVETRSYRNDNTLSSISTPAVGNFTYTYDGRKRKLSEGGTAVNGAQAFTYDGEGRLTAWTGAGNSQSWTLSLEGNWQSTTRNSAPENRTHNAAHELTAIGANALSYDARGNLTQDDRGNVLTWDFENKLVTQTPSGGTAMGYLYDVLGRKVGRIQGGLTTAFVHAGDEVIAEYDSGDLRIKYILGESIDKPVAYNFHGTFYWYSSSPLGSVAAISDSSGAVVERYRYDAYGTRTVLTPGGLTRISTEVGNQTGFTGRYHDATAALIDFRFRYYDPRLGRFVSRDDEYRDGRSLYGGYFVPNHTDPSGHYVDIGGFGGGLLGRERGGFNIGDYPPGWCFINWGGSSSFTFDALRIGLNVQAEGLVACLPGLSIGPGGGGGGTGGVRPPPPPPAVTPGVTVIGTFRDLSDATNRGPSPVPGKKAVTRWTIPSQAKWGVMSQSSTGVHVGLHITYTPGTLQSTYYEGSNRQTPNPLHGTLGAHEDAHKDFARAWWSTSHLQDVFSRERFKLEYDFAGRVSQATIDSTLGKQASEISRYIFALHNNDHETQVDRDLDGVLPAFFGARH